MEEKVTMRERVNEWDKSRLIILNDLTEECDDLECDDLEAVRATHLAMIENNLFLIAQSLAVIADKIK